MAALFPGVSLCGANRNPLNNRNLNLRVATVQENNVNHSRRCDNKSGYRGVYWSERHKQYRVIVQSKGKRYEVGLFRSARLGADAYDRKALEVFGEFANLNFPTSAQ
jgi:hypothetical protein